jgi:hypothetical protein
LVSSVIVAAQSFDVISFRTLIGPIAQADNIMLRGRRASLHAGTVVYVSELAPTPVRAVVQTYDAPSGRWRVELQGSQWQGRTLLVPEEAIRISFCILPSSLSKLQSFVDMTNVDAQGVCGRGLIVNVPVKKGNPILAEPPLIVAGALVMPHRTHHSERWLAFAALQKQAKAELQAAAAGRASSFEFSKALAAFNDLGMADQVPSHVLEGAENIATKLFGDPSRTAEVSDVLMKFHSNQFRLDNGAEPADTAFAASGVYPCMSRINHSCAPTMNMTPARLYAQLHGAKRVILFSPADFGCLYPFPMHHPCDRQSQVDLYAPDLSRFPRFRAARPLEAILQPGEVLYLPQYWWHHIENLDEACVSLNFWFKDCAKPEKVVLPLSASQHLAMRRNIEKLVAQKLGATKAQLVLPLLASHTDAEQPAESAVPEVGALREEVTRLLTHVMPAADVPAWLCELVEGRFPRLAHQETGQPI